METLEVYLTELSSASATPGGGSAAMLVAAAGAALLAMVCRISAANPKFTRHREAAERIAAQADELRAAFLQGRRRDEAAFNRVVQVQRMPKESDEEKTTRGVALEQALQNAAAVPLEQAGRILLAMRLAVDALAIENTNLVSDLGCAAEFSSAAIRGCAYNVQINHKYMKSAGNIAPQLQELRRIEGEADELLDRVRTAVADILQ